MTDNELVYIAAAIIYSQRQHQPEETMKQAAVNDALQLLDLVKKAGKVEAFG